MTRFAAVYSGIGTQWEAMGAELMDHEPDFARSLRAFDSEFAPISGWSVEDALYAGKNDIAPAHAGHPCIIAVGFGLTGLLRSLGFSPAIYLGHSGGEVTAAWAAGALSASDAARIAHEHEKILRQATGSGSLLHLSLPAEYIQTLLPRLPEAVAIAAHNSPRSTVCSGSEMVLTLLADMVEKEVPDGARFLRVDVPFHSQAIVSLLNDFARNLAAVHPAAPHSSILSSLRGGMADVLGDHDFGPDYWVRHIRQPVRFADAMQVALRQGFRHFVEISPHAVLQSAIADNAIAMGLRAESVSLMAHGVNSRKSVADALAVMRSWSSSPDEKALSSLGDDLARRTDKSVLTDLEHLITQTLLSFLPGAADRNMRRDTPFQTLGLTSALAVRFASSLAGELGISLPVSTIFNFPNIQSLAESLHATLTKTISTDGATEAQTPPRMPRSPESGTPDPIAVVGFACRFPGGITDEKSYWRFLAEGRDGVIPIPADRWDKDRYYHPDKDTPGTMYTKESAFLTTPIDEFDPFFFNISAKEARQMDPQQRMLLELSWQAFEHAAINPDQWRGRQAGVFLGMTNTEYSHAHRESYRRERIDAYSLTGTTQSGACGRLSYFFGFEGPCWSVDTACSSGIVAMHSACQSLTSGESDLALLGAVTLMLTPDLHICFTKLGAISPDGRSKAFDDGADGYGRGEGGAVLLLKRLADAQRDKDTIFGLIKGSAINQDGRSNGLTAPNGVAQQKVIARALARAGKSPHDISYVEAHGTGTALGDSIELEALAAAYCEGRDQSAPLRIGSVKANIGHLEPAAALASLIKVLLCMRHKAIPANIHIKTPNRHFDFAAHAVEAPTTLLPWQTSAPLCAGVSAFGFSGINGHAVIEEYRPPEEAEVHAPDEAFDDVLFLPLSAKTPEALRRLAEESAKRLRGMNMRQAAALCRLMAVTRPLFPVRTFALGNNPEDLAAALLDAPVADAPSSPVDPVLLFTGQGSQHPGMGQALYARYPVFREAMDKAFALLSQHGLDGKRLLFGEATASDLEDSSLAQPLIAAVSHAIWKLWQSFGLRFSAAAGHSIGEYPAAVAADIMRPEDMLRLALARGRAMQAAPDGAMAVAFAGADTLTPVLAAHPQVVIAAINAQDSTTLSGPADALNTLLADLQKQRISAKALHVSKAYHSPSMEAPAQEFIKAFAGVSLSRPGSTAFVSTVTGRVNEESATTPDYWTTQILRPVHFADALQTLTDFSGLAVEAGPSAALSGIVRGTGLAIESIPTLSPNRRDLHPLFSAVGKLFLLGQPLDFSAVFQPFPCLPVNAADAMDTMDAPGYPFQRERHWMPVENDPPAAFTRPASAAGKRLNSPVLGESAVFESVFDDSGPLFVWEHCIFDKAISPAAGHMAMLLAAARDLWGNVPCELTDMDFLAPLVLEENAPRLVQIIIEGPDRDISPFRLVSLAMRDGERPGNADSWQTHCTGFLSVKTIPRPEDAPVRPDLLPDEAFGQPMAKEHFYRIFLNRGYAVGPGFQRMEEIRIGENTTQCRTILRDPHSPPAGHIIYPGSLDSVLQTILPPQLMNLQAVMLDEDALFIPMHVARLTLWSPLPDEVLCFSEVYRTFQDKIVKGNTLARDANGKAVLELAGCVFRMTDYSTLYRSLQGRPSELLYARIWQAVSPPTPQNAQAPLYLCPIGGGKVPEYWDALPRIAPDNGSSPDSGQPEQEARICILHTPEGKATVEGIAERELLDCEGLLRVLQHFAMTGKPPCLHLVTHGLFGPEPDEDENSGHLPGLAGATLHGLAEVFSLEHPGLLASITDLPLQPTADDFQLLQRVHTVSAPFPETAILAVREGTLYRCRLRREVDVRPAPPPAMRGAHLITGGTGSLGMYTALQLARGGAACVALFSRSGRIPDSAEPTAQAIRETGCGLLLLKGDVRNRKDLAAALAAARKSAPLRGIFHAAGILEDGLFAQMSPEQLHRATSPKIQGALLLDSLTRQDELDFFVCYSSAGSLIGSRGQANYNAANHFLNALCRRRKAEGLPALAPCFGPWAEGGMAENQAVLRNVIRQGILPLSPEEAFEAMLHGLSGENAVYGVMRIDWKRFSSSRPLEPDGLFGLLPIQPVSDADRPNSEAVNFFHEARNTDGSLNPDRIMDGLRMTAAKLLGQNDHSRISPDRPLMEYGFDSLMAVEFRNALARSLDMPIPVSATFEYPTLEKFRDWLCGQAKVGEKQPEAAAPESDNLQHILDDIDALLEEQNS